MCASTLCPLLSSTRNIALGSASITAPSISITPSFLAIASLRLTRATVWTRTDHWSCGVLRRPEGGGMPFGAPEDGRGRTPTDYLTAKRRASRPGPRSPRIGARGDPSGQPLGTGSAGGGDVVADGVRDRAEDPPGHVLRAADGVHGLQQAAVL